MKKKYLFLVMAALVSVFLIVSCGRSADKTAAKNYDDLVEKYEGKEFDNCGDFFDAMNEALDVLIKNLEKAKSGVQEAEEQAMEIMFFLDGFQMEASKWEEKCPNKFTEFEEKLIQRLTPYEDYFMVVVNNEGL